MVKLQEFYSIIMFDEIQNTKISDRQNNFKLNSMGFNSFMYEVYVEKSGLRSLLKRYWLRHIKATFVEEFFVLLQSLSVKIASMSISELLPNRPAAAMIPDDNNAREIIRYFIDVQKRAKCLGVISSHAQIPKPIFFLRAHCNGKRGLFLFTYRKFCYYFPSSFYSKV